MSKVENWPPPNIDWYYADDSCAIANADCRKILPLLPTVDFVLTDPPYEIVATGGGIGAQRQYLADITDFTDCGFDMGILQSFHSWACFCSKTQLQELLQQVGNRRWMLVTWNKPNPTPLSNGNYLPDTEYIIHAWKAGNLHGGFRDKSRFIVYPCQQDKSHPNEKPIPVILKMLRMGTQAGDLVLDPFMGSGTTLRAAKDLGLRAIGIEISRDYCDIAIQRLRQSVLDFSTPKPEPIKQMELSSYELERSGIKQSPFIGETDGNISEMQGDEAMWQEIHDDLQRG